MDDETIKEVCVICHEPEREVYNKRRMICHRCYQKERKKQQANGTWERNFSTEKIIDKHQSAAEIEFSRIYFNHKNWVFEPAIFTLGTLRYTPDFYDGVRNCFIEVAGTRQAYHFNKEKYKLFRLIYPKIKLEIREPNGKIVDENSFPYIEWPKEHTDKNTD